MKSKLVLAVIACLVVTAAAQDLRGGGRQRSRAEVYALEGLGALGGCVGCGCLAVGGVALLAAAGETYSSAEQAQASVGLCVAAVSLVVLPAASGYGAAKAGDALGEDGSEGWAIGGAYGGAVVYVGLYGLTLASTYSQMDKPSPWLGVAVVSANVVGVLAIPVGAVLGYNLGPPSYGVGGRLQLPAMALTSVELPDHSVEYGVKVQLAGLKF